MSQPSPPPNVERLFAKLLEEDLQPSEMKSLNEALRQDASLRELYRKYMIVDALLRWEVAPPLMQLGGEEKSEIGNPKSDAIDSPSAFPPIIVELSPGPRSSLFSLHSPVGGFLFSYVTAALILGVGVLIGWTWKTSYEQHLARNAPRQADGERFPQPPAVPREDSPSVGRISGMVDCRWADPSLATVDQADVPLGRKYVLASGLLEITYDTGAKVILQGPVTYEVESARGGFLSLGRLTARVESRGSRVESVQGLEARGERTVNPTLSEKERQPTASLAPRPSALVAAGSRLSTPDPRLFSVRTPTAVVTDLGTEFGVEVDKSGATKSHVFRGKVELRPAVPRSDSMRVIQLGPNESAKVGIGRNQPVAVNRDLVRPDTFVRRMPEPVPIQVFSTGLGLKVGDPDPHWQIVARSDDPNFKPRAAVVTTTAPVYLPNDPSRSQWVSTAGNLPSALDVQFLFRTTFELAEASPDSIVLRGGFIADNRVDAIRINGKSVSVPKHGFMAPFNRFSPFIVSSGFVRGTNILEILVRNVSSAKNHGGATPMALRVELRGFQLRGWHVPAANAADKEGQPVK